MKPVLLTYLDGRTTRHRSVIAAAASLGCSLSVVTAMARGKSPLGRRGLASVVVGQSRRDERRAKPRRRREYRGADVPAETVERLYRYARKYASQWPKVPAADKEDAIQHAVIRVSEDESNGLYERYRAKYTHAKWLWLRVRIYAGAELKKAAARLEAQEEIELGDGWMWSASYGLDERLMLDEMPAECRPLAEALLEGRGVEEARGVLGLSTEGAREVADKLGEWLRKRRKGG